MTGKQMVERVIPNSPWLIGPGPREPELIELLAETFFAGSLSDAWFAVTHGRVEIDKRVERSAMRALPDHFLLGVRFRDWTMEYIVDFDPAHDTWPEGSHCRAPRVN